MPWFEQGMFWQDTQFEQCVDCFKRYLLVGVGKWSDWKGTRGMVWDGKVSHLRKVMLKSAKDWF
jgi:hypothetical protein